MPTAAWAELGGSQETGTPSGFPAWEIRIQVAGPSSAASQAQQ